MSRDGLPRFIRHRVNRIADLARLDAGEGAEVDLRSDAGRRGALHLSHDPWAPGDDFDVWLDAFAARADRGTLVLNTKEDGLEADVLRRLAARGIEDFFFLDTTPPTLVRWALGHGEARFAVRLSRYEPAASLAAFRGRAAWAWVDCFDGVPLPADVVADAARDFRICLVSPELQGAPASALDAFAGLWPLADAVCTKAPDDWRRRFRG